MQTKQVLTINIGSFGAGVGKSFIEQNCAENGIGYDGSCKQKDPNCLAYFSEQNDGKYKARSIFCDSDPAPVNEIAGSQIRGLIDPNGYACGNQVYNNYASAVYDKDSKTLNAALASLRKLAEQMDIIGGIMLNCSLSGSGSGILKSFLDRVKEFAPNATVYGVTLLPSNTFQVNPQETYNSVLAMPWYINY